MSGEQAPIRVPRWCWEYIQDLDLVAELPLWKRHVLAAQIWRQVEPRICGACLERAHSWPGAGSSLPGAPTTKEEAT